MLSNSSRGTLMSYTDHSVQRRFKSNTPTDWISQHCLVITWRVNASALVSSCRAAVWTVIRADKRSVWRDSNESRGFVPLLAHKHYIELFSNFLYRFRGKLYRDNYRYRIIAQPYLDLLLANQSSSPADELIVFNLLLLSSKYKSQQDSVCVFLPMQGVSRQVWQ